MKLTREYLDAISRIHGTSFYLLDSGRFKRNFINLTRAFRTHYNNTTIAYSYKTNYLPKLCKMVDLMGGYAEVVSSMEMTLAIKLGIPPKRIFFNGPYKDHDSVVHLLNLGGTVNLDSEEELKRIVDTANQHTGSPFKLGLRCNFDVNDGVKSRFGFDVSKNEFMKAQELIKDHPKLELNGLHCHFATRTLECWKRRTEGMISIIDSLLKDQSHRLRHVSLGGGIYGPMPNELKNQFSGFIPDFESYADVSAKAFSEYFKKYNISHGPELIIEPGTALVADTLSFVCQVNGIKECQKRTIISLNGSAYNINPKPNRKNVPIKIFHGPSSTNRKFVSNADFAGYTCIESDYAYKGFTGEIAVGDFVVFEDIGSYSIVMKPPFILPNVSILEPDIDYISWSVIKRQETFDDVFSTYNFG